jgi:hypothetical protein
LGRTGSLKSFQEGAVALRKLIKGRKDPITVPSFSYAPNDGLAQLIVEAWSNPTLKEGLLDRDSRDMPTESANNSRVEGASLLNTARLLMACTPHGI